MNDWEENVVLQRMWSEVQVSHTSGILKKVKGGILSNPTIAIREWIMSEKCKTLWFKLLLTTPLLSIIFNVTFAYNQAENIFRPQGACCEWGAWAYVSLENSTCFPLKSWTQLWECFDQPLLHQKKKEKQLITISRWKVCLEYLQVKKMSFVLN